MHNINNNGDDDEDDNVKKMNAWKDGEYLN